MFKQLLSFLFRRITVVDGDTIIQKNGRRMRIAGIEAPEMTQKWGKASKAKLKDFINQCGSRLRCEVLGQDCYNRDVGILWGQGNYDIGKLMVSEGWAFHNVDYPKGYELDQVKAKKLKKGFWIDKKLVYPSVYRKAQKVRQTKKRKTG